MSTTTIKSRQNTLDSNEGGGVRKAAIIVSSLERDMVDSLLDLIEPSQAHIIRQAVIEMEHITPEEQERVLHEFFIMGSQHNDEGQTAKPGIAQPNSRIECDVQPARHTHQSFFGGEAKRGVTVPQPQATFGFLEETPPENLATVLAEERPQTIALVLSRMPPARAGNVLVQFSPNTQAEVARRLIDLEETDAEILREVELELQKRLSQKLHTERRRVAGVPAVADIIEASSHRVGTEILRNLEARDQHLAQCLRTVEAGSDDVPAAITPAVDREDGHRARTPQPLRFEFTDLVALDDDALLAITENIDLEILVLALLDTPGDLSERLLQQMPRPRAAAVRRRIETIGPLRLDDVEEARRLLLETAADLHAQGRINRDVVDDATSGLTIERF